MAVAIESGIYVANMERADFINEVMTVEKRAWPTELQATREKMEMRLNVFPEGFFVAKINGIIKGVATAQITQYPSSARTWNELTDNGFIQKTHDPKGNALYIVSTGVAPDTQGQGIGGLLINAQKNLARSKALTWVFLGARIPGYKQYCEKYGYTPVETYLTQKTENGESIDPEIRFYKRQSLDIARIAPNFEPDVESKDYGVVMAWNVH